MKFFARLVVLGVLLPVLGLALGYTVPSLSTWWIELLQYLPYPAYLLPALAALVLSWRLSWAWRAAAVVALGLVVTVIMGLATGRPDAGTGHVRMMTFNIKAYHAGFRPNGIDLIAREVAAHQPDILVMQDAAELLPRRRSEPQVVASIFEGRQVYAHGQYIVSTRYPLRDCTPGDLSYRDVKANYVRCVVTIDGEDVDLVTAHLLSPRRGLNATRFEATEGIDDWQQNFADRLTQVNKLAADIATRSRPMILAGDLNASQVSPVIRTLEARGLRDAFASSGFGYGYTHGHALRVGFSFLRIDHILVSSEIGVADVAPGGWEASEHRPVIADLWLHRGK